jgi:hypothetical protein
LVKYPLRDVQNSFTLGQAVDPATAEIMNKTASGMNHKPESIYHGLRKKNLDSHSSLKKTRGKLTEAEIDKCEVVESAGCNKLDEKKGSPTPS